MVSRQAYRMTYCPEGDKQLFLCVFDKSCEYKSTKFSNLKRHQRTMHERVLERHAQCCGERFPTKGALIQHRKSCHEGNNFSCRFCDKVFTKPFVLDRHLEQVHYKEWTFPCKLCNYGSASKSNLQRHYQAKHKDRQNVSEILSELISMKQKGVQHRNNSFLSPHPLSSPTVTSSTKCLQPQKKESYETDFSIRNILGLGKVDLPDEKWKMDADDQDQSPEPEVKRGNNNDDHDNNNNEDCSNYPLSKKRRLYHLYNLDQI